MLLIEFAFLLRFDSVEVSVEEDFKCEFVFSTEFLIGLILISLFPLTASTRFSFKRMVDELLLLILDVSFLVDF